jgi:hypothetical protein
MVTLTLEKLDGNLNTVYTWTFSNFKLWGLTLGFPIVDVPLPQEDQQERILMKLMGNTSDTKFSWTVKDETVSQVTEVSGIDTLDKQIDFWRSNMRPVSIEDSYIFTINFPTPVSFKGTINSVRYDMSDSSPVSMTGTFNFMEGTVNGGVFESDPPSPPLNVVASSPAAGQLRQDWDAGQDPGSGAVSLWKFEYRVFGNATWIVVDVASTNFDHTKTGLAAELYECRMRGANGFGDGQPSPTSSQVVT